MAERPVDQGFQRSVFDSLNPIYDLVITNLLKQIFGGQIPLTQKKIFHTRFNRTYSTNKNAYFF